MSDAAFKHNTSRVDAVKWIALLGREDTPTDGVADYCAFLARELEEQGTQMSLARVSWMEDGWIDGLRALWRGSADWRGQWVLLQYTALSWSRRGFPFGAVAVLAILRRRGVRCAVVFHEPNRQSESSARWIDQIRGACQGWGIRALYRYADKAIFADPLGSIEWLPKNETKAAYIPIGANIPEPPQRTKHFPRDGRTVAVFCLSDMPNVRREVSDIYHAMNMAAANGGQLRLVLLGRGTPEAHEEIERAFQGSSVSVENLGLRSAEEVSRFLGEADAMLCVRGKLFPRRGSALAGIACGLPIIAYAGAAEGTPLAEAGVELVPYGDREALGMALARVLADERHWQQLHERNRRMHGEYFSWDRIAERFRAELAG
ncbi:MAG TPA: glycosyltransferase family 4 protein [Candidatus Acidoferrales bacterium]|nr:glycosyltransferase family 4 protein [Candidatus Acidoferrales bacterium]